jgi:AcrR family transcriptional regulator
MMPRIDLVTLDHSGAPERHERADAAANRALILQTAARLFAERGVANVCMAEIAEAAGVGKGTLYRRFASKAELCLSLMDSQLAEFQAEALARFRRQTSEDTPYLAQLADFLEALVHFTEVHAPLLSEVERGGLLRVDAPLDVPHFWQFMTVSALLRSAARRGELAPDLDIDYLGEALLAPLQIDIFRYQRDARGYSLERIASGLRQMVERLGL